MHWRNVMPWLMWGTNAWLLQSLTTIPVTVDPRVPSMAMWKWTP